MEDEVIGLSVVSNQVIGSSVTDYLMTDNRLPELHAPVSTNKGDVKGKLEECD
ncbi:MAG: hypothetical protein AB1414_20160 [bacterium]